MYLANSASDEFAFSHSYSSTLTVKVVLAFE